MDPLFSKNTGSTTVSRQFTGKYKDLDPEWFQNVGYVIVFTLFIQILSSIAFAFGFQLLRFCSRLKDRGYTCKNNIDISKGPYNKQNLNTKKTKQSHWLYLYTGPELFLDFRYAYTLMIIFVTLFYGSGMPILYLAAALHFFVLYWLDKVFLFKVYQIPKNFDLSMSNLNINILYLAPVFHLAMAIYLFGNISIFYDPDEYDPKEEDFSHIKKWWIRLYRKQNYVVSIFFLVALGLFVLRIFFWTPFLKFLRICFPQKEKSKKDQEDYTKKYWDFLGEQNIKQELKLLSLYINAEQNEEKPLKELIQQYKYRYSELKKRIKTAGDSQLVGLFSYDVRHNPNYKSIFNWDNRVDVQKGGLEEILAGVGVEQLL